MKYPLHIAIIASTIGFEENGNIVADTDAMRVAA